VLSIAFFTTSISIPCPSWGGESDVTRVEMGSKGKHRDVESRLRWLGFALDLTLLVLTAAKQIFDFLGYMWLPMLGNFLNMIFLLMHWFGASHR